MWFEKVMARFGYAKIKPKGKPGRKPRDPNAAPKLASNGAKRTRKAKAVAPMNPTVPAPGDPGFWKETASAAAEQRHPVTTGWPFPASGNEKPSQLDSDYTGTPVGDTQKWAS